VADFARTLLATDFGNAAPIEHRFPITGLGVCVNFSDPVLATAYTNRLPKSDGARLDIDHHLIAVHAADLDWSAVPEWTDERCSPRRFHAILTAAGLSGTYPFAPGLWQIYDPAARKGVQLTGSRADLPPWDFGAPLRHHLRWLLAQHGFRLAHAATLGRDGRGVLIVGDGGSGKSGTTLAGIAAGMTTCGDDYVALGLEPSAAHLMFRVLKQDRPGLSRIAALHGRTDTLSENWQGKVELDPEALFPGCLTQRLTIGAALLPSITRRATAQAVPIGGGGLMRAMVRSNINQFPGEDDHGLGFFAKFLAPLRCFRLELALDPAENARTIDRILQDLPP